MYNDTQTDHLTEFLKMRFSKDEVFIATQNYFITGTNICWFYSTVFWQIDDKEQIHAGKIMQYDRFTGKRVKEPTIMLTGCIKPLKSLNLILVNVCLVCIELKTIKKQLQL
jgi:hypothetical protein